MEHIKCLHLLARTDELNRLIDYRADRQRRTTAGIAVEFRQYHSVEIQTIVELLGGVHSVLTGHGIDHEQGLARRDSLLDSRYLLHHLLIHSQTTGRIDDHDVIAELSCLRDSVLRLLNGVRLVLTGIYFRVNLLA